MNQNGEIVLITGSTGMIGTRLKFLLKSKGYTVRELSRKTRKTSIGRFHWDITKGFIDEDALGDIDHIIHLAGASVASRRWTTKRKQILRDSRIKSAEMLIGQIGEIGQNIKTFISASAIGYYGSRGEEELTEESQPGTGFLAELCRDWEKESSEAGQYKVRTVINRIGLVIEQDSGVLKKFLQSFNFGFAVYFGKGAQFYPWIQIDDLCRLFIEQLSNEEMEGAYNAVAPEILTNKEMIGRIRKMVLKNAIWLKIPEVVIKWVFGEMGTALTQSAKVSANKVLRSGFTFQFPGFDEAIRKSKHDNL